MNNHQAMKMAVKYANEKKFAEADKILRDILKVDDKFHPAFHMLGQLAFQAGRDDIAAQFFYKASTLDENVARYFSDLAEALFYMGNYKDALLATNRAIHIDSKDPRVHFIAGNILMKIGQIPQAIKAFQETIKLNPDHGYAHNNLGSIYEKSGQLKDAKREYNKAIELDNSNILAHNNLATLLISEGDLESAKEILNNAIKARPDYIEAHHNLSALKKYKTGDEHIDILKSLLQGIDEIPLENRIRLFFILGKVHADIEDYDAAFDYYQSGNKLKRSTYEYVEDRMLDIAENIKTVFSKNNVGNPNNAKDDVLRPIFVIGMPRSGSSLVEQILSSHSKIHGAGELNFLSELIQKRVENFPYGIKNVSDEELQEIGVEYLKRVQALNPDSQYIVDKMPSNFQYAGLIAKILPEALIINTNRNPMDCCVSIYTHLFVNTLHYTNDMKELGNYFNIYSDLMEHWREVLSENVLYDVSYEDVVENLEVEARKLIDFVGLDWEEECLSFYKTKSRVTTASAAQVRKPIYKSSLERWRVYEKHLGPLINTLKK